MHILVRGLIGQNWKVNDDNVFTEYVNLLKWTKGFKDENVKVETLNQNGIRGA